MGAATIGSGTRLAAARRSAAARSTSLLVVDPGAKQPGLEEVVDARIEFDGPIHVGGARSSSPNDQ